MLLPDLTTDSTLPKTYKFSASPRAYDCQKLTTDVGASAVKPEAGLALMVTAKHVEPDPGPES